MLFWRLDLASVYQKLVSSAFDENGCDYMPRGFNLSINETYYARVSILN